MLNTGMAEQRTKKINMHAFSTSLLKFVLRLMCTGQIDPSDWPQEAVETASTSARKTDDDDDDSDDSDDELMRRERLLRTKIRKAYAELVPESFGKGKPPMSILLG